MDGVLAPSASARMRPQWNGARKWWQLSSLRRFTFQALSITFISHRNQHDTLSRLVPWRHGSQTITAWARTSESMRQRQKNHQINASSRTLSSNWFRLKLQIQRERTSHQSTRWICQQTSEAASWQQHLQPIHLQHAVLNFTTCVLLFLS